MATARRRTVSAVQPVEIRWRTVKQGRDSRLAGRAATCRALATAAGVRAIVAAALAAVVVMVWVAAVMGSAGQGRGAEQTG
jgi:hypothetical protein